MSSKLEKEIELRGRVDLCLGYIAGLERALKVMGTYTHGDASNVIRDDLNDIRRECEFATRDLKLFKSEVRV